MRDIVQLGIDDWIYAVDRIRFNDQRATIAGESLSKCRGHGSPRQDSTGGSLSGDGVMMTVHETLAARLRWRFLKDTLTWLISVNEPSARASAAEVDVRGGDQREHDG
jgi:hypothetical protein